MCKHVYLVEIFIGEGKPTVIKRDTREMARRLAQLFKKNKHKVIIKQIKLTEENVKVVR